MLNSYYYPMNCVHSSEGFVFCVSRVCRRDAERDILTSRRRPACVHVAERTRAVAVCLCTRDKHEGDILQIKRSAVSEFMLKLILPVFIE